MNPNPVCFDTWKKFPLAVIRAMLCAGILILTGLCSKAEPTFVLQGNDGSGSSSFNSYVAGGGNWSSGAAPAAGNNYDTMQFGLRTPGDAVNHIFAGDSLTISNATGAQFPGVSIVCKGTGGGAAACTVNNLIVQGGGIGNANNQGIGQIEWIAGNMNVESNLYISDINTAPRWVGIASTLTGTGAISNECYVIYSGNNTGFTGPLQAGPSLFNGGYNGYITVTNEAAMGGNPASFNAAQLYLNGGTFNPEGSFALDYANSGITIAGNNGKVNYFDIPSGLTLTNKEPLAGAGTLTLTNAGTLEWLGTASSFTGTLAVNAGSFILGSGGSLSGANTISVASGTTFDATATGLTLANGQTLAGNGSVLGAVTAPTGSAINPGGQNLITVGSLTLSGGATLSYNFSGTTNSVISATGNVSVSGTTTIQLVNVPANNGTYTLIAAGGTLGGSAANFHVSAASTRTKNFSIVYNTATTPQQVQLVVSGSGSPANLVWQGSTTNNVWDIDTTSNWLNGANNDVFFNGDTNNFTDVCVTSAPVLNVTVFPAAVYFNNSLSNYSLTGSGAIAGAITLTKAGTALANINMTNTYSGGTLVTNGTLQLGAAQALGSPSGLTPLASVSANGTLDINGLAVDTVYTNAVQINNGAYATQGAIDSSTSGLTTGGGDVGLCAVSLAGDSTVSATGNWQIGNTGLGIIGNGHTLVKMGVNFLYLKAPASSALGSFVIDGGGVLFFNFANSVGTTTPITLTNGGFIDTWDPANNFTGLTFYNPIIVSDPVNGGYILNRRQATFNHPAYDVFNGSVILNGPLTITNTAYLGSSTPPTYGEDTFNGNISGTNGVIVEGGTANFLANGIQGGNLVTFNGANSYSGPTMVTNLIQLLITTANQSGGSYDIVDYGDLDVEVAAGHPTIPMSSLRLESVNQSGSVGNIGFTRLSAMPASPVIFATNLYINAGEIIPPTAGYSIGTFPLIGYSGSIGGNGFGGLTLATPPTGVSATLFNDTAHNTIDLVVTATGIAWTGSQSTNWDMSTANWFNPVSSSAVDYVDGDTVIFGDPASTNVFVTQTVQPGGMTFTSTNHYTLSAVVGGGISGSGALIKNGSGLLCITCTNNLFTGGTYINGGTLQLCDSNYVFPYGGGALNNNLGVVQVANGGTLDINGVQVPNYSSFGPEGYNVFLSGSGVGGSGALVNNTTNIINAGIPDAGYVTLTGNATVGGVGDINMFGGVSPQLSSQSGAFTLTKVGTGSFRIRYVTTVSTNFGPINILGGIVSYESSSSLGLGDPTKNIFVGTNAGFAWGTAAANCTRSLICSNGATLYGYNITTNVYNGPVTLVGGNVNLSASFYDGMIFSNTISGAGGVTVTFQSLVTFAAANTYSGNTIVQFSGTASGSGGGSVLSLVGNASIANSPLIWLQGTNATQPYAGALNVSGLPGGTLTLASGQTLRGDNGSSVKGSVTAGSGSTVSSGGQGNIQSMTFSSNLTLSASSTVAMDVDMDTGTASNDVVSVLGTNNYAGTLLLTNMGATALTVGEQFHVFNNAHFTGNFATVSGTGAVTWTFNPATGIATVASVPVSSPPGLTSIGVSGANVVITGTNAQAGTTYYLLSTTNLMLPLSQWAPVATSVLNSASFTFTGTNVVSSTKPRQFFILSNNN
jgi:fibronectin-binding autotransporter adhesin